MRLVIPWMAGVFCGEWASCFESESLSGSIIICSILFATLSLGCSFLEKHSLRWCFGVSLTALLFFGGWLGITRQLQQSAYDYPEKETVYRVLLSAKPIQKERSILCHVVVKEQKDSLSTHPVDKQAILYLKRDSLAAHLKAGMELLVSARIAMPTEGKNFDEFDYRRYLKHKGISGTGYVSSEKWKQIKDSYQNSYRIKADSYRESILSLYRKLGFDGDELAVLSALTVGDKAELSDSVRESYSVSGASHVLALSGLHIGLLYALFFFMLKPFTEHWRAGRYLRSFILILLLWMFAYFTGLSSSVVRSACMFSILALSSMLGRNAFTFNTLAATAFFMLLCCPLWLFDVGFQLSFLAVAAILLIQQPIYRLLPVKNRIVKYVWSLMSVSIAAQIGTAPLVIYYFSRFSTHFLLTNIVVIPLVTTVLYLAVLMLVLSPLPWVQAGIAYLVNFLLKQLNVFVRWVEHLPYSSFDGIWLYKIEIVGLYVCVLLVFYYFISRRAKRLLLCLVSILLLCTFHVAMSWIDRPQRSIVFYNLRNCPVVHCVESDGASWLSYGGDSIDSRGLKRAAANFWRHYKLQDPVEITSEHCDSNISNSQQIINFHGCSVCMVADDRWRNKKAVSPLSIQYLYLCKGYTGKLEELTALFRPSCVILDASLSGYKRQNFKDECKRLGIRYLSLLEEGSVQFLL